jgi:hypothetical protein
VRHRLLNSSRDVWLAAAVVFGVVSGAFISEKTADTSGEFLIGVAIWGYWSLPLLAFLLGRFATQVPMPAIVIALGLPWSIGFLSSSVRAREGPGSGTVLIDIAFSTAMVLVLTGLTYLGRRLHMRRHRKRVARP